MRDGLRVELGQQVGTVSMSGSAQSTVPHLHIAWSHLRDGEWITVAA